MHPTVKKKYRIFDSMALAASSLGVSRDTLRAAKESGCKAFENSRVKEKELLQWMSENGVAESNGGPLTLKDQKTAEEIRKLRIKNDKDQGKLIAKAEVAGAIRRVLGKVSSITESKLVAEYPTVVAGLDPAAARVYGRRLHDLLMAECQALAKEFPE